MNTITALFLRLHAALLCLYPRQFRGEFGEEMQATFRQMLCAEGESGGRVFWREVLDLPGALLRQYAHVWLDSVTGGPMIAQKYTFSPASSWHAFLGALPFLAFGVASILSRNRLPAFHGGYYWLAFYLLALIGLTIGWIRRFPLWSYAYLGWSLTFAWWWSDMETTGLNILGYTFKSNTLWEWRIWLPLVIVAGVALLWTRTLAPLKRLFAGIWQDWTRLTLAMYALPCWFILLYDENHHPYLLAFMIGSTLAAGGGAWAFLRAANTARRVIAILGGIFGVVALGAICDATWDWHAYYNLPIAPQTWYMTVWRWVAAIALMLALLFWPVLVEAARRLSSRRME